MILESIVTTVDRSGRVNLAPMGPIIRNEQALNQLDTDPQFLLRPFEGSQTFANLIDTRCATIHVTDDVSLFARGATGRLDDIDSLTRSAEGGKWHILKQCHRWFAVEVQHVIDTSPRYEMECRTIRHSVEGPFFGFNRAKHAVIEAAILATRTHLIDRQAIARQLEWLSPMVEKTGGAVEREAFAGICRSIQEKTKERASGASAVMPESESEGNLGDRR